MKEFIFNWNIENISHSWHRAGEHIISPSFVADTFQNTVWNLRLYPKGYYLSTWLSLYLYRDKDEGPKDFFFDCELSCVSANNLTLASQTHRRMNAMEATDHRIGNSKFLQRHQVFVRKKDLYLSQNTLKLRCRMWKREGDVDEFGQCFGCTRLEIERIRTVEDMNPRINKEKTVSIHSKKEKTLLISIDVYHQKSGLKISLRPTKSKTIKFSTFKFFAVGKNRKPYQFITSWLVRPHRKIWRSRFSDIERKASFGNKFRLTCEFICSTGKETKSLEKVSPCSFKFPEFSSNCILSCIPSGKLSDCPNIYKDLWNLYTKQILCDVELKTQTTSFWVHKTVLCARSPVFLAMFTNDMKENLRKCVKIEDLEDDTLEKLLKFLYTDSFEETQWDAVLELYYSADKYQVERLKYLCCSYFMDKINDLNVCELLMLADRHNDSDLSWKVEEYIASHHERIFTSSTWKQFSEKQPLLAAKTKICGNEEDSENENPAKACKLSSYPNAMDDLKSVYHSQIGSDIVIQTTTTTFPAHKTILCAGSSTLRKMLASGKSTDSLKTNDLEDDIVSRLLLFLYTDSLGVVTWETATKLYHAAVAYKTERLKIKCSCFFLENLDAFNASKLLQLAHEHRDFRLKSLVEDFISLRDIDITVYEGLEKIGKTVLPKRIETRAPKRLRLT